ncbi:MAG: DNRLRE domain-containing protein, partial [Coriobacteriia bacterium]|nr:DNRLRE domain-containing protein [Coriobacteriia bacterium]
MPTGLLCGFSTFDSSVFSENAYAREGDGHESRDGQKSKYEMRGGRYRAAPASFSFNKDSTSQFKDFELVEISEDSNVYHDSETGEIVEEFFSSPVRFEGDNGQLVDIDPSLIKSDKDDYVYESAAGESVNFFPEAIDEETPFLLTNGNYEIAFTLLGKSEIVLDEVEEQEFVDAFDEAEDRLMAATYDVDEDTVFRVTSSDIGIKSEFVLDTPPELNIFSYELNLTNLAPELSADSSEVFLYSELTPDTVVATIPRGLMWDSSEEGAYSDDISYEIETLEDGKYILSLVASKDYLNDSSRVYPVTVDPSVTWQGTFASKPDGTGFTTHWVRNGADAGTVIGNTTSLPIGIGSSTGRTHRSFMRADSMNSTIKGKSVNSATLYLRQKTTASGTSVSVRRVNELASGETNAYGSMTWNNQPASTTQITTFSTAAADSTHSIDITSWARGVSNGSLVGNGLSLRSVDTSKYAEFHGANDSNGTRRPRIVISYGDAPVAPASIAITPTIWRSGQVAPKMTWGAVSGNTTISSMQYRILSGTTFDASGAHTAGSTVVKDWTATPNPTTSQSTSGFNLPTNLAQGCYRIQLRGVDAYGATGAAIGAWLHVDNTAPTLNVSTTPVAPATSASTYGKLPNTSWTSATDSHSPNCSQKRVTVRVRVQRPDNSTSDWRSVTTAAQSHTAGTASFTTSEMPANMPGLYTLQLQAIDRAGNESAIRSYPYYYDGIAPTLVSAELNPPPNENQWYKDEGIPSISWEDLADLPVYSGNQHKLQIAISKAGNPVPAYTDLTSFTAFDSTGVEAFGEIAVPHTLFPESGSNSLPTSGKYEVRVRPVDKAGNEGVPHKIDYWLDTVKPELTLRLVDLVGEEIATSTDNNTFGLDIPVVEDSARIDAEILEEHSGFEGMLTIEGISTYHFVQYPISISSNFDLWAKILPNGTYRATLSGKDKAGNTAQDASIDFRIQTLMAAPTISPMLGNGFISATEKFDLSWRFVTGGESARSGLQWAFAEEGVDASDLVWTTFEISSSVGSFSVNAPIDENNPSDATYTLLVRGVDKQGIPGRIASVDLYHVATGPEVEITSFDAGIITGTVTSRFLYDYTLSIKEKDASEESFEELSQGSANVYGSTLGFIDIASTYPSGQAYTIRLQAKDKVGNISQFDFDIENAVGAESLIQQNNLELQLPEDGKIFSADTNITTSALKGTDLDWYIGGKQATSSEADAFSTDFANSTLWPEGSYHSVVASSAVLSAPIGSGDIALSAQDFKYVTGGEFVTNAIIPEESAQTIRLITREITTALPISALGINTNIPNLSTYVSFDGGEWYLLEASSAKLKISDLTTDILYSSSFRLKLFIDIEGGEKSIALDNISIGGDFLAPDIFHIDFLSQVGTMDLVARDRLDYKTYFTWSANQSPSDDINFEIFSAQSELTPIDLWKSVAEGLTENYFASPNVDYSRDYYYMVRPVRIVGRGESAVKIYGTPSNVAISHAPDSNEFVKRLGIQDYWEYESVDVPQGSASIEKSMGNFVYQQTDRELEGATFLQDGITRTYNAQSSLVFPFGVGTDFSYNVELLEQAQGDSYVFKDDTGTLRTFSYSEAHDTHFTRDSMRARLQNFDEPRKVKVRVDIGSETEAARHETLLVGHVVTLHKKNEYWFNQGGQLILITDKAGLFDSPLEANAEYYVVNPDTQDYLVFSYNPETGLLSQASDKTGRTIQFVHNSSRLISAVRLPDDSIVSYSYDNMRLTDVRLHDVKVSGNEFSAETTFAQSSEDIVYSYDWSKPHIWSNRHYMTTINGAADEATIDVSQTTIDYKSFEKDELFLQAVSAISPLGDKVELDYCEDFKETSTEKTPYGLNSPTVATKTKFTIEGHPYLLQEGTAQEVEQNKGRTVAKTWQNYLLTSTTTHFDYHELADDGTITTVTIPVVSTTDYNALGLSEAFVERVDGQIVESGESIFDADGTNEELSTEDRVFDENGQVTSHYEWEFDDDGDEIAALDAIYETVSTREYYANGLLRYELTSLQELEDGEAVGASVPQVETNYEYDRWGNVTYELVTEFGSPDVSRETVREFDFLGRIVFESTKTLTSDSLEEVITFENIYDNQGRLTSSSLTEPSGRVATTSTTYNPNGSVKAQTDDRGITTTYTYDKAGRVTETIESVDENEVSDKITTIEYGYETIELNTPDGTKTYENVQVTTTTDSAGLVSRDYMDALGRAIRSTSNGINIDTTYTRDDKAFATITLPEELLREDAKVLLELCDKYGNLQHSIEFPTFENGSYKIGEESIVTTSLHDASGKVLSSTDALGNSTYFTYDDRGDMASATMPESNHVLPTGKSSEVSAAEVSFINGEIDSGGTISTAIDALGRISQVTSDPSGKMLSATDFGRASIVGNSTDVEPIVTTFTHNDKDQVVRETLSNGDYKVYSYDVNNNNIQTQRYFADGSLEITSKSTFDDKNQLTSTIDYQGNPPNEDVLYCQYFEYDSAGKVIASYEGHNLPQGEDDEKTYYHYDAADRLIGITYPDFQGVGSETIEGLDYSFDEYGMLSTVTARVKVDANIENRLLEEYSYDLWGQVAEIKAHYSLDDAYMVKSYTYDSFGRIMSIEYRLSSDLEEVLESFNYEYDKSGNIAQEIHEVNFEGIEENEQEISDLYGDIRTYEYDEVGRLVKSESVANGTSTYAYDKAGNRRFESSGDSESWSIYNGLNQLTEKEFETDSIQYEYDAKGNQVREIGLGVDRYFTYSTDNRLLSAVDGVSVVNENTYRGDGQRISKVENGQVKNYIYQDGVVLYTADEADEVQTFHLTSPGGGLIALQHFEEESSHFTGITKDIR